jgi:hypothetical protein
LLDTRNLAEQCFEAAQTPGGPRGWNLSAAAEPDADAGCPYVSRVAALAAAVMSANPRGLNVFRTTTAGWPKWGNWGFPWPQDTLQPYRLSQRPVRMLNAMAMAHLRRAHGNAITILDGYASTVGRPEHTERQRHAMDTPEMRNHFIGGHLVHYQPDVPLLHNQALFSLLWPTCVDAWADASWTAHAHALLARRRTWAWAAAAAAAAAVAWLHHHHVWRRHVGGAARTT